MRFTEVRVERSEHLTIPRLVPAWEVPILEAIHGAEKIIVIEGGETVIDREYPETGAEFDRLSRRYGRHIGSDTDWVVKVYGEPPRGIAELEKIILAEQALEIAATVDPTT